MGLIQAALGAAGGTMADQWLEYFYCEAIPNNVLVKKGQKRTSGRSSNTKGSDNVISNGSVIAVADGQCMIIVEQGKVVEFCSEPGEFTYDSSTEPSLFYGSLGKNILETFKTMGKRFAYGGEAPKDQRVYYFNTKEILGNKYGTPSPIPFRVVDQRAGIDIDISVKCFGEYSLRLVNPILFYTNVCGNVADTYEFSQIAGQMKSEFLTALQPAFARISEQGIRYSSVPGHTNELSKALKAELSAQWAEYRGIEIQNVGMSSIKADEEDERMLKELQRNAAFTDPTRAAAYLVGSQGQAMQDAAKNTGGAAMGFMGMNAAAGAGGMNAANLFQMGQQQQMQQQQMQQSTANTWACSCGTQNTGKFCSGCGKPMPVATPADGWKCSCGATATGKFCPECGSPKPAAEEGWNCPSCGKINKGKFCADCGTKKPAGEPIYQCDKCGWKPAKGAIVPKFCPECGDPFDEADIVSQ